MNEVYLESNFGGKLEHKGNLNIVAKSKVKQSKEHWKCFSIGVEAKDKENQHQLRQVKHTVEAHGLHQLEYDQP